MTIKDEIERIFHSNYNAMLILANRLLHDEDAARDIVHDVFATLLDGDVSSVNTSYLLNAVRYACLKRMRSLSVRERFLKFYSLDMDELESDTWPEDEDIKKLNDVIDRYMPEQTRRVLRLKFNSGLTYREIADELSVSEVAVYKHLRQALSILRQHFNCNER